MGCSEGGSRGAQNFHCQKCCQCCSSPSSSDNSGLASWQAIAFAKVLPKPDAVVAMIVNNRIVSKQSDVPGKTKGRLKGTTAAKKGRSSQGKAGSTCRRAKDGKMPAKRKHRTNFNTDTVKAKQKSDVLGKTAAKTTKKAKRS